MDQAYSTLDIFLQPFCYLTSKSFFFTFEELRGHFDVRFYRPKVKIDVKIAIGNFFLLEGGLCTILC